jgi:hypothetical protein
MLESGYLTRHHAPAGKNLRVDEHAKWDDLVGSGIHQIDASAS